jgi:hypothetical protein
MVLILKKAVTMILSMLLTSEFSRKYLFQHEVRLFYYVITFNVLLFN